MLLFVYTTARKRFVIFTCTALNVGISNSAEIPLLQNSIDRFGPTGKVSKKKVDHFFLPLHQHGRCDVTCKPAINCTSPIPTNTVRLLHWAPSLDPSS